MKLNTGRLRVSKKTTSVALVAVAALAAVLVIVILAGPDDDAAPGTSVVARVDGAEITEEDVTRLQTNLNRMYNMGLDREEALERVIGSKLIYREAEREGLVPTIEETDKELQARLHNNMGLTKEDFIKVLEWDGLSYEDYLEEFQEQLAVEYYLGSMVHVPEVTDDEVRRWYESYAEYRRQRYPDDEPPSFEEMESRMIQIAHEAKRKEAVALLIYELRSKAVIEYL